MWIVLYFIFTSADASAIELDLSALVPHPDLPCNSVVHSRTNFDKRDVIARFDREFRNSDSFSTRWKKYSYGKSPDRGSPEYLLFIEKLEGKVFEVMKELEDLSGQPERLVISNQVHPDEIIFKFMNSETYLELNLRKPSDILMGQPLRCSGPKCRILFKSATTPRATRLDWYDQLSHGDRDFADALAAGEATKHDRFVGYHIDVLDRSQKAVNYFQYQTRLRGFFKAYRIPPEQQAFYKADYRTGAIQVDILKVPYVDLPQGGKNWLLNSVRSKFEILRKIESAGVEKSFVEYANTTQLSSSQKVTANELALKPDGWIGWRLTAFHADALAYFNAHQRQVQGHAFQRQFEAYKRKILAESEKINRKREELIRQAKPYELRDLARPHFQIEDLKFELMDYALLPDPVKNLIQHDLRVRRIGSTSEESVVLNLDRTYLAYRSLLNFEYDDLIQKSRFEPPAAREFEQMIGFQVSYFQHRPGYSGRIIKIELPGYLLREDQFNFGAKQTIMLTYPVSIDHYQLQ